MEGNKNIYGYGKIYLLCCSSVLHSLIPLSNTNLEHAAWSNTKELIKELCLVIGHFSNFVLQFGHNYKASRVGQWVFCCLGWVFVSFKG